MFKIEPIELELEPKTNKDIFVRFIAIKELKLKTTNSSTDLVMEILEGES
jgi:hypothetical protein